METTNKKYFFLGDGGFFLWRKYRIAVWKNCKGCKPEAVNFFLSLVNKSKEGCKVSIRLVQKCDRRCCGLVFKWMFWLRVSTFSVGASCVVQVSPAVGLEPALAAGAASSASDCVHLGLPPSQGKTLQRQAVPPFSCCSSQSRPPSLREAEPIRMPSLAMLLTSCQKCELCLGWVHGPDSVCGINLENLGLWVLEICCKISTSAHHQHFWRRFFLLLS